MPTMTDGTRSPTPPPAGSPDATAPPAGPPGAWAALARGLLVLGAVCTGVAALLAVLDGGFWGKLVYSFAIGTCCWALIDGARIAVQALVNHRRRRLDPASRPFQISLVGMLPLVLLGLLLGPPLGLSLADALGGRPSPSWWNLQSRATQITLAITLLGTLVSMAVVTALERSTQQKLKAEAAERTAAQLQLRMLQSQLEPHMLFNTLANLRVLIGLDAARAQTMLDHLIAFLRSTLEASRRSEHPLSDEFARVDDYLALMAVRMGPRLHARLDLPAELAAAVVPPLLLQPLVENAIQHGLEPKVGPGVVAVTATRDEGRLILQVRDDGVGLGGGNGGGTRFGLQQVRERLRTLYGDQAGLTLDPVPPDEGTGTIATIHMPWPGDPARASARQTTLAPAAAPDNA
jgi:signal transduction histidine kinase